MPAGIWQKSGPLTADESEQVRLHPYQSERVLSRSPFLSRLAGVASAHTSAWTAPAITAGRPVRRCRCRHGSWPPPTHIHAMTEPRAHRESLPAETAAKLLGDEAGAGRLDAHAVTTVLEAAGQRAPRIDRPAGLTDREVQVVALLARGLQTKEVARVLGISVKTADRRVQNAYAKDRRLDPRGRDPVRDGARAVRMGRTPDCSHRGARSRRRRPVTEQRRRASSDER